MHSMVIVFNVDCNLMIGTFGILDVILLMTSEDRNAIKGERWIRLKTAKLTIFLPNPCVLGLMLG